MKVTKRQLRRLIREESRIMVERRNFNMMLLQEAEDGGMMKMAFAAIEKSADAAKWIAQFLKANPEIGEAVMSVLAPDEKE
jgi:hypothetical protein